MEKSIDVIISDIMNETDKKVYIIVFAKAESLDSIKIILEQKDRVNNKEDEEVIKEYVLNNYGYRNYEIININSLEKVEL